MFVTFSNRFILCKELIGQLKPVKHCGFHNIPLPHPNTCPIPVHPTGCVVHVSEVLHNPRDIHKLVFC